MSREYNWIVCIPTCVRNRERLAAVWECWAPARARDDMTLVTVYGRGALPRAWAGEVQLQVDVEDRFENLPQKTHAMVRVLSARYRFRYLLKVDDDAWVRSPRLFELDLEGTDYVGNFLDAGRASLTWHFGRCVDVSLKRTPYAGPLPGSYARGMGYFLSARAAAVVAAASESTVQQYLYEDMMVAHLLEQERAREPGSNLRVKDLRGRFVQTTEQAIIDETLLYHPYPAPDGADTP